MSETKAGNRNSAEDRQRIRTIRKAAKDIDTITMEMEPQDSDEYIQPAPVKGAGIEGEDNPTQSPLAAVIAIKSESSEWALDVLGVPFGGPHNGKDSQGEYFDAATKTYHDRYPTIPAVYYHGLDSTGRPSGEPQYIGKATYSRTDDRGHWYRVILDKTNEFAGRVWNAAQKSLAKASSGSIAHLVRKVRSTGYITHWPVAELSVLDTSGPRQPINQYAVALPVMKAVYDRAGLTLPDDIEPEPEANQSEASGQTQGADAAKAANTNNHSHGVLDMDEKQVQQLIADGIAAAVKAQTDAAAETAKRQKEIDEAVAAGVKAAEDKAEAAITAAKAEAAAARRLPFGEAPYQAKFENIWQYDSLDAADLAILCGVLGAVKAANKGPGASEDLRKALAIRIAEDPDKDRQFSASKAAMKAAGMAMKANELNQSTLASFGDEWVGVTYSTQLWDKIRLETMVVGKIPSIVVPQGSESIVIPLQSTSPTFYKVAQASAQDANPGRPTPTVTTSKLGTANQTLTVSKLGAAVNWAQELDEDALIPWANELRRDLVAESAEVLEHIAIDGDTATGATTNINHIGGTPGGTEAYLLFNGFRKLALVTNTANSRSGGALGVTDYLETLKLMGLAGRNAIDKSKVSFLTDPHTNWASLTLAEVQNRDVFVAPTLESGMLTNLYGVNIMASSNMHRANQDATYGLKANTSGKVDLTTASNNTTGSILAVRWDQWRFGYKRRMTFEIDRDPISDSTVIVVMMRIGMINRDNEASAISYGLTGI